jgi:dCMP deaminase
MARWSRPSRQVLHMQTASSWAQRALCSSPGREVGCVITNNEMDRIISFGYNGPARGLPHNYCAKWKESHPPGEGSGVSRCPCIHAEVNAIARSNQNLLGCALFVTLPPCEPCAHLIVNTGIASAFFAGEYANNEGIDLLRHCGKHVERVEIPVWSHASTMFGVMPDEELLARTYSRAPASRDLLKQRLTSVVEEFLKEM